MSTASTESTVCAIRSQYEARVEQREQCRGVLLGQGWIVTCGGMPMQFDIDGRRVDSEFNHTTRRDLASSRSTWWFEVGSSCQSFENAMIGRLMPALCSASRAEHG